MVPGFLWGKWMEVMGSIWSDGERQESRGDGIVGSGGKSWCEQWLFKREGRRQVLRYDGDECDKGRMPTKIELTLKQSQQGVNNDVL
nr:hypothetical protein [Tanacetum cinerariifolium]